MKRFTVCTFLCIVVLLLAGCGMLGPKGSISGTITDAISGDPVTNVAVTVGSKTVFTGDDGSYIITGLEPKAYTLEAKRFRFEDYSAAVTITQSKDAKHNFELQSNVTGTINGIVTDGRGGPGVAGATVTYNGQVQLTDANGYFTFVEFADYAYDMFVEKEGRGTARVQDVSVGIDETLELEIPTKASFHPDWSHEAPTITHNIEPGAELSGTVEINISVDSERPTYLIYAYFNGEYRNPRDGMFYDVDEGSFEIDTTLTPNGPAYLKVLVYDDNNNSALYIVPVTINNLNDDEVLPGDLETLYVLSNTYGQNLGFYSAPIKTMSEKNGLVMPKDYSFDPKAAPEDSNILINLWWDEVEGADGYNVYRKFYAEEEYTLIGNLSVAMFDDYGAKPVANAPLMYKVVPYNSYGESNGIERIVMPLPAYNVYLQTPGNLANDISLKPTFTWENRAKGGEFNPAFTTFECGMILYDATDYIVWGANGLEDVTEVECGIELQPGAAYSWDVTYSLALAIYEMDDNGFSAAYSTAGEINTPDDGTGSINGEFIFTTTTTVEE